MARKYTRRKRRFRRKRKFKRKNGKKLMWKVAKAACRSVLKKESSPLYYRRPFATYSPITGQYTNQIVIASGPENGFFDPTLVRVSIPQAADDLGLPGTRKDLAINITGIKVRLRFFMPLLLRKAKLKVYLGFDKVHESRTAINALNSTYFDCPDQASMLRNVPAVKEELQNIVILDSKSVTLTALTNASAATGAPMWKDCDIWWKPKGTFTLKFDNDTANGYLNRSFFLCIVASYPYNPAGDQRISFGGTSTTYYRDL